MPAHGYQPKEI